MSPNLPLLPPKLTLVDPDGSASALFAQFWQQFAQAIIEAITQQQQTLDRIRRVVSHTVPTTIMHAHDDGSIVIDNHTRVYGDATELAITGSTLTGLAASTTYASYYDDTTLANPSPSFQFTTDLAQAQTVAADGRHFLGIITTPAAASGQVVDGGGVYAAGSNVGGELD